MKSKDEVEKQLDSVRESLERDKSIVGPSDSREYKEGYRNALEWVLGDE